MWFTIAKYEANNIKAGTVFIARKDYAGSVMLFRIKYGSYQGRTIPITDTSNYQLISTEEARKWLTKPSNDFDSVIEEAIMICEGAYC